MTVEWESHGDGRYVGFLMRPPGLLTDFAYEVAIDGMVTSSCGGGHMANPVELPPEVMQMLQLPPDAPTMVKESKVHDCTSGGTANDRAAMESPSSPATDALHHLYRADAVEATIQAGVIAVQTNAVEVEPKHLLAAIAAVSDSGGGRLCARLSLRTGDVQNWRDRRGHSSWTIKWSLAASEAREIAEARGAELGYVDTLVLLRSVVLVEDSGVAEILLTSGVSVGQVVDAVDQAITSGE